MIIVKQPHFEDEKNITHVHIPLLIDNKNKVLKYSFDTKYKKYLTVDKYDFILVALFYYAMKEKQDIVLECPISERLYYQLKYNLMDALHKVDNQFENIQINCKLDNTVYTKGEGIGAGLSCGVDSFCSLYTHNYKYITTNKKINILTFFKVGAFNYADGKEVRENDISSSYDEALSRAKAISKEINIDFLYVESNLAEIFPMSHALVDAIRNCGIPLMFQKLFSIYYYSSTYNLNEFRINPSIQSGYYEIYTLPNISTDNVTFYSANASYTRFEKTELISDFYLAKRELNVCTTGSKNCGMCSKCSYTLLSLDIIGELENFSSVFNLEAYKKTRNMKIGYALASQNDKFETYYLEICKMMKKYYFKKNIFSYFYFIIFLVVKPVEKYMRSLSAEKKRKLIYFAKKFNLRVPY